MWFTKGYMKLGIQKGGMENKASIVLSMIFEFVSIRGCDSEGREKK